MAKRNFCCFKGRGEVSLANYAARLAKTAGLLPVGNTSELTINATENSENVKDYTSPSGGTACTIRELDTVTIAMSLRCHSPRNWALAANGSGEDVIVEPSAVVDEPHVLWAGAVEPLDHLIDESVAITVTSVDGQTTYLPGRDYEITPAGSIKSLEGSTIPAPTVTAGAGQPNIHVSYTRRDQYLIQLYSTAAQAMAFHFDGFNVAETPIQATQFDLFKVMFGPAAAINIISENVATLQLTGTVERDRTRPMGTLANPFSQYGTLKI